MARGKKEMIPGNNLSGVTSQNDQVAAMQVYRRIAVFYKGNMVFKGRTQNLESTKMLHKIED